MKYINALFWILVTTMGIGLLVAMMPLAIVFPDHGQELVRIQAAGGCVGILSLMMMFPLGLIADAIDP